ncbi:hypothetical protein ACN4C7_03500 [Corynebacterium macclintockiae]|uniref:hypothetical protein n=1 Tax=Corynebacterium macclintockiae TaxID=2913501 RepID=UPI003EC10BFF
MNSEQRLEELKRRAKELAERIGKLEDQLNNAQPTTGLLGRWAINRHGKQVLITADRPVDGWIETTYVNPDGTTREKAEQFDSLTFPEQTTRPQDVPAGEAWLIDADDGDYSTTNTPALKIDEGLWTSRGLSEWTDDEVELITPLIPALPQDMPEAVTTEEEYGALPEGSVVAKPGEDPWTHKPYVWEQRGAITDDMMLSGTTRQVLRHGWGTSPDNS